MEPVPHHAAPDHRLTLSLSQRDVWLDQRAWPDSAHLNIGGGAYLVGTLHLGLFNDALRQLVAESDVLRLAPHDDASQTLLAQVEPRLDMVDMTAEPDPKEAMRAWWQRRMQDPFVLDGTPPWRFTLLCASDQLHGLTIQFHHLIMDGWGTTQVMHRWSEIYNALVTGRQPGPTAALPYVQFIEESHDYRNSAAFERDASFWQAQLPSLPAPLITRRYDNANAELHQLPSSRLAVQRLPRASYAQLEQHAVSLGHSAFNFFLAALALYFARINNCTEVVIGVPTLNRGGRRYRATPGMFVGVLALKVEIGPDMTVSDLLASGAAALRGALRHPRYPLSELGRDLQLIRHGRDGVFDLLLSFERQDYDVAFGEATLLDSRQLFSGAARYPLGVTVCEFHPDQDLELILDASSACFTAGEADLLGRRLWHLVQTMMLQPAARVQDVSLLPPEERWALLHGLDKDASRHDLAQPYVALFEHQVALRPEALALVWDGGSMDYAELDRHASRLAQRLRQIGAGRDKLVALALERSPDMVIALLAIAKAGAAFLPLDPDAPVARLADILLQSAAVALLLQERHRERLAPLHAQNLVLDGHEGSGDLALAAGDSARTPPQPNDLAYVLFTSGSTGQPKGVMVEHATLSRRLAWLSRAYGVDWHDRSAQATQVTFDPSLIELFLPLIHGASVALPPPGRLLPESLVDFAARHAVTIMAFVPSTLSRFLDAKRPQAPLKLRVACCGGEVLPPELANRFIAETGARLYNVYGPTETAIFATAWECRPGALDATLPIGSAIDDTCVYVLDAHRKLMPMGVVGEIYLGGAAIARGYLNRPELDREVFLNDPFRPGARMYRTGDRGWQGVEGNLHFTGRIDRQIKLRGYRIELGEIEAVCQAIDGVQQVAAQLIDSKHPSADKGKVHIHVWIGAREPLQVEDVQRQLRTLLPDYMVPSGISILPELAESSTGKIDYAALPDPVNDPKDTRAELERPATALESELLGCWERVLEARPIRLHDNFFDLGGDSLAAVSILCDLEKRLGRKVPLYLLIEHPTIERLALALGKASLQPGVIVRLTTHPAALCPPLFLAASGHGDVLRFQNLAQALGHAGDVYMLQPPMDRVLGGVTELAQMYAQAIAQQGLAPGVVAGFSVGGIAALETARLLAQGGLGVRGLVLVDTIFPQSVLGGSTSWRMLGWLVRNLHIQELSMNGRRLGAMFNDPGLVGQVMALRGYHPSVFDGPTVLIKSSGLASWDRWFFRPWRKLMAPRLTEHQVHGLHGSMFEADNVQALARLLTNILQGEHASSV